jgi:hypothetical protein
VRLGFSWSQNRLRQRADGEVGGEDTGLK